MTTAMTACWAALMPACSAPGGHVEPFADAVALIGRAGAQVATDFGGNHIGIARFVAQEMVQPGFRQAKAIKRSGVEIAHARIPGAGQHGLGVGLGNRAVEVADRGRAEAQFGEVQPAIAQAIPMSDPHIHSLHYN